MVVKNLALRELGWLCEFKSQAGSPYSVILANVLYFSVFHKDKFEIIMLATSREKSKN